MESLGVDVESMRTAKESGRLLDVTLRKVTPEGQAPARRVFGKLEPQRGVLLLNIADVGGKQGDTYETLKVRKLETMDFVNGFNGRRGPRYGNVTLGLEGNKLGMRVDGTNFEAKSHLLDVNKLRAVLKAEFEPFKKEFSFWSDGERVTAKYRGEKTIDSFSLSAKGLTMTYSNTRQEFATRLSTELSEKDVTDMPQILQRLQLIDEKRRLKEFIDSALMNQRDPISSIGFPWPSAKGACEANLKGEILGKTSPRPCSRNLDGQRRPRHPFSSLGTGRGSEKGDGRAFQKRLHWRVVSRRGQVVG